MSYGRFASPHQRLKPITRRQNPQVPSGLHLRGGSVGQILRSRSVQFRGAGHLQPSLSFTLNQISPGRSVILRPFSLCHFVLHQYILTSLEFTAKAGKYVYLPAFLLPHY